MKWLFRKLLYFHRYVCIGGFPRPENLKGAVAFLFHHMAKLSASDDGTELRIEIIHRGSIYWSTVNTDPDLEADEESLVWACQKLFDNLYSGELK